MSPGRKTAKIPESKKTSGGDPMRYRQSLLSKCCGEKWQSKPQVIWHLGLCMGFLSTPELRTWLDLSMITKHVLQGFQNLAAIHRTETKLQSHMLEERAAGLEGSGLQVEWADSMANNTALKASEPGPPNLSSAHNQHPFGGARHIHRHLTAHSGPETFAGALL